MAEPFIFWAFLASFLPMVAFVVIVRRVFPVLLAVSLEKEETISFSLWE